MLIFKNAAAYIGTCKSIKDKIAAIENVQNALMTTALAAVEKGDISQYTLNDGQTIITTTYRNSTEIINAYNGFEAIKNKLRNQLNGRMIRLVDHKTFNGYGSH